MSSSETENSSPIMFKNKWKYLSAGLCLVNIITLLYVTEQITFDQGLSMEKATPIHLQSRPISDATATSGKLFKMDAKTRTFTDTDYSVVTVQASKTDLKFKKHCESDHWIVLTTIFNVTSAILDYNGISNWCTVIAGDKKSIPKQVYNTYLNTDKVVYLDVDDQNQIFKRTNDFDIFDLIPYNHFGRKNIGFLYAMMNGAKYIYDTDDDNKVIAPFNTKGIPILGNDDAFPIKEMMEDARLKDQLTFNVFLLWSKAHIWPRGYDISALTESFKWHKTVMMHKHRHDQGNPFIIQQWLSNIEPDYDALERLIGKNIDWNNEVFTMEYIFDIEKGKNDFAVSVPNHLYIPFNAQMTVWDYRSFLFLYLPITVHGRVSDIWRSYFAQAVMHALSLNDVEDWKLLYCPVLVNQYRNSHNYLADFQSELPLYLQTHELLIFLHSFAKEYKIDKTKGGVNIGQILLDLYVALYEYNIIQIDDVKGIHSWINDIVNKIGWHQSKW
eukprot:33417_1